jgi:thiamine-monophosphate kinase
MPADTTIEWLDALTDGFRDECDLVGASVAGGDIARSDTIVLGVTALGDLGGIAPITRSGARPGDQVAIAGRLGCAAAGLALFSSGATGSFEELLLAHRRPEPPYAQGPRAAELGATAMVDVSDGLVQDLGHVAAASGVGVVVEPAAFRVPAILVEAGRHLGVDPLDWILTGGDDHALAAAFPPEVRLPPPWQVVGEIVRGQGVQVKGRAEAPGGWDHFRG